MKLANKLERILNRRGVTIEDEETTMPSVRKKAPKNEGKSKPRGGNTPVPAGKVIVNRRKSNRRTAGKGK